MNKQTKQCIRKRCPFPKNIVISDVESLSIECKQWLAAEVVHFGQRPIDLSRKYGIKVATIKFWARKCRLGHPLHELGGRPQILDPISQAVVVKAVSNNHYQVREEDFQY